MSSNRRTTDKQFSEGTTIDGSEIDHAVDEVVEYHNEVPAGYTEGRYTKTDYVGHWSPARTFYSQVPEADAGDLDGLGTVGSIGAASRTSVAHYGGGFEHYFPFLVSRNWLDETYPLVTTVSQEPAPVLQNEYRHKGFVDAPSQIESDRYIRATNNGIPDWIANDAGVAATLDATIGNTMGSMVQMSTGAPAAYFRADQGTMNGKYMAVTFSYYFDKPVVLSALSVCANQEHPISYFTMGDLAGLYWGINQPASENYKSAPAIFGVTQWDNEQDAVNGFRNTTAGKQIEINAAAYNSMAKTGNTFYGSTEEQKAHDNICIQVSIEDTYVAGKSNLDQTVYNNKGGTDNFVPTEQPRSRWLFNRNHTTSNTTANAAPDTCGGAYTDMVPAYPGGPMWGRWMVDQNLNIPIPAGSKVKFSIICKGLIATQGHEWNTCLTVLEELED